jgi:hypothetical protein
VTCRWDSLYALNSNFSQRIEVRKYAGGDAGIRQGGIPVTAKAAYRGRAHLRSTVRAAVVVSLRSRQGQVFARQELGGLTDTWKAYDFELVPDASDPSADFCLSATGAGILWVDQVSLSRSDAIGPGGLRRDVADAVRALKPTALRWPAGPGAADYDWSACVGPRDERPVTSVTDGSRTAFESAPNDFGTDEFLALCRDLDAAPMLMVSARLGLRPALYGLEYCNGEPNTPMGKLRASHGHVEPYGVKLWGIHIDPAAEPDAQRRAETFASFAKAMSEQDPSVRVIAPAQAPPESVLSVTGAGLSAGLLGEVFRLFRANAVREAVVVDAAPAVPQLGLVAGRGEGAIVLRADWLGDKELKASVTIAGLGNRRLAAQAEVFRFGTAPSPGSERITLAGDRFSVSLHPRTVHVFVLRLEGK